jgi:hypothetical protein
MADSRIVQRGVAKIETSAGVLDAFVGVLNQTIRGKHNWTGKTLLDIGGFEAGWDARNGHIILTFNFKLTAASYAQAVANGAFLLEYAQVNVSGADLPWMNTTGVGGFYTGAWCYYEGGTIDLSNEQTGGMEIALRKFKDPTQNAQQFVTPS